MVGGLLGRFPTSMFPVALVIAGERLSGSYAFGGAMAAGFSLAAAVAAPFTGALVDRAGQRRAGSALLALFVTWSVLLVGAIAQGGPRPAIVPLCVLAGASLPNVGAYTRVRWGALVAADEVETSQALESINDEVNFLVGPAGATLLATALAPIVPLAGSAAVGAAGAIAVIASRVPERRRAVGPTAARASGRGSVLRGSAWILLVVLGLGMALSGVLITVVATAEAFGRASLASVVFVLNSTASLTSALVVGRLVFRRSLDRRLVVATGLYAATLVPFALAGDAVTFAAAGLIAGAAIAPIFIFANSYIAIVVDAERATEAFSWLAAGTGVGLSLGSVLAGAAVDAWGADGARLLVLGFATLPFLAAWFGARASGAPMDGRSDAAGGLA